MYSIDNRVTWKLITSTPITGTIYDWKVPRPWGNKKKCFIKVAGFDCKGVRVGADKSDSPFTIEVVKLESPNGGDTITCGVANTITWTTNKTKTDVTKVKLYYTKDKGVNWIPIGKTSGDPESYDQWIPTCNKPKVNCCKVRVELIDKSGNILGTDASDSYFTIQPAL
jgi:hypothetical protein